MNAKLIHPVFIVLQKPDKSATDYDEDFNEPLNTVTYGNEYTIKAQVKIYKFSYMEGQAAGFQKKGDGYILVKIDDANNISVNDKILKIDGREVEYYIIDAVPAITYDTAKYKMLFFETKAKGKI